MSIPHDSFSDGMHQHQKELFGAFDYRWEVEKVRIPQFFHCEWHRGARKTTAMINLLIKEACRIPMAKYIYVGPFQTETREVVWDEPTMLRPSLPDKREMGWKLNEQKMLVKFANGSMLKFGGADQPDSWRGINAVGMGFDEWALMKHKIWTEIVRPMFARQLHPMLDKYDVFRWALFAYTPKGINHATTGFDAACMLSEGGALPTSGQAERVRENCYASRLDGELTGILIPGELTRMQEEVARGELPQSYYDQEIRCSRVTSEEMTLITTEMLHNLNQRAAGPQIIDEQQIYRIVSIDPAFGGDTCMIMGIEDGRVEIEKPLHDKHNTGEVIFVAKEVAKELGTHNFICDSIGNGLGVAEGLATDAACYNVQFFCSSESPDPKATSDELQFANRRAEAYFYTATQIRRINVGPITNQRLMRGLPIASRYSVIGKGKMIILPKTKIKEELKRSPDDEDCYVMGIWGLQHVEPESSKHRNYNRSSRPRNAMA